MGKSLLKSKLIWVNGITAAVSVIGYFAGSELLASNPEVVAILGTIVGVLNVVLRLITKEPITSIK